MKKQEQSPSDDIKKAASIIKKGSIVVFPTDTVFGIGCRWDNEKAVDKIYKIKSRPKNLPFPVLISDDLQLKTIAIITPLANDLIKRYWPGGLTIVVRTKTPPGWSPGVNLRSPRGWGYGAVGFRVPDYELTRELIRLSGTPIIGTSANLHGKPSVKYSKDLDPKIIRLANYVLEGQCQGGTESTVVDASGTRPKTIRAGAVAVRSLALAIDTTNREKVTVAIKDNWSNLKDRILKHQTGSQALIPAIIELLKKNKCTVKDITSVSVNLGPGSFTGTRIGTAVANALGFALDIPVNNKLGKIAVPKYEPSKFD